MSYHEHLLTHGHERSPNLDLTLTRTSEERSTTVLHPKAANTSQLSHLNDRPLHARPPLKACRCRVDRLEVQRLRPLSGNHELLQLFHHEKKGTQNRVSNKRTTTQVEKHSQQSACGASRKKEESGERRMSQETSRPCARPPVAYLGNRGGGSRACRKFGCQFAKQRSTHQLPREEFHCSEERHPEQSPVETQQSPIETERADPKLRRTKPTKEESSWSVETNPPGNWLPSTTHACSSAT